MAEGFKIPRVRALDSITDGQGKASVSFIRFWDKAASTIERQEVLQGDVQEQQQALLEQLQEQLDLILAAQEAAETAQAAAESALAEAEVVRGEAQVALERADAARFRADEAYDLAASLEP